MVVGADDGKVRLYSEKTLTQAKTSMPGMGLPITNVDVTYDGGWAGAELLLLFGCQPGQLRRQPACLGGCSSSGGSRLAAFRQQHWPSLPALKPTCLPFAPAAPSPFCFAGKWVLATTKNYLMVLKTSYRDPKSGKELCGFTNRMGANAPAPRLLRLKTGGWVGGWLLLWGAGQLLAAPQHGARIAGQASAGWAGWPAQAAQLSACLHPTCAPTLHILPAPCLLPCACRGCEADRGRRPGEGALHLDHREGAPGALGGGLLRQLHRALELQVGGWVGGGWLLESCRRRRLGGLLAAAAGDSSSSSRSRLLVPQARQPGHPLHSTHPFPGLPALPATAGLSRWLNRRWCRTAG